MKRKIVLGVMLVLSIGCAAKMAISEVKNTAVENQQKLEKQVSESSEIDAKDSDNLSKDEKMEILAYINGIMDPLNEDMNLSDDYLEKKANEVWAEAEEKYSVTEQDILDIMTDIDLAKEYYGKSNSSDTTNNATPSISSTVKTYDATLDNNGYPVVVSATKDYMSEYIQYVTNNDTTAINNMIINGYIAKVDDGTKVLIKDVGFSVTRVKILEGGLKDLEVYTINECIDMK